jgi:BsuBI/PstI restriction endonuclease domain/BsuBI/PstI restriction endonuclease HTH domain
MNYLTKSKKAKEVVKLINEAIEILVSVGIPTDDKTERSLERMAMAFLAIAGVTQKWTDAVDNRFLKTRDIITFNNTNFEENISSGSYDDIRRKDLKLLVLAGLILNSSDKPNAATNDPTRGYNLETSFMKLVKTFQTTEWNETLQKYIEGKVSLKDQLARKRNIEKVAILLPNGTELKLSAGQHNLLQKLIIEEFLPRYGQNCQVLYIGDTANKMLHLEQKKLEKLNFFELPHDELPDIIAYNSRKNWLYLIEAVHSSGSISETRLLELKRLTEKCTAEIIYVTAFLNRAEFRKWASEIAWETEVWIADNPDHLVHFNGDKFLGPYNEE